MANRSARNQLGYAGTSVCEEARDQAIKSCGDRNCDDRNWDRDEDNRQEQTGKRRLQWPVRQGLVSCCSDPMRSHPKSRVRASAWRGREPTSNCLRLPAGTPAPYRQVLRDPCSLQVLLAPKRTPPLRLPAQAALFCQMGIPASIPGSFRGRLGPAGRWVPEILECSVFCELSDPLAATQPKMVGLPGS